MSNTITRNVASASTLKGQSIYNLKEEKLGKIEDIMLDLNQGKIAYVVLSFGGFMGIGNKLFALPMQALTPCPEKECFKIALTEEQLENAPGFDKDSWPKTYDETFVNSVYSHYGVKR